MKLSVLVLAVLVTFFATADGNENSKPRPQIRYPPPSVRGRPSHGYKRINFRRWRAPPGDWLQGHYYFVNSSHTGFVENTMNMQIDLKNLPALSETDVEMKSTYDIQQVALQWLDCTTSTNQSDCIEKQDKKFLEGVNYPINVRGPTDHAHRASWSFTGIDIEHGVDVGFLSALMGWGTDTESAEYYMLYHVDGSREYGGGDDKGAISLVSRNTGGLTSSSLEGVMDDLSNLADRLEDSAFADLVQQIRPMTQT